MMRTAHGVTEVGGVKWLVQNQELTNAIGLPGQPAFQRTHYRYDAPHQLDVSVRSTPQLETDLEVIKADPVARFLLPTLIDPMSEELMVKYAPPPDPRIIDRLTYLWGAGTWKRSQSFRQFHKGQLNRLLGDTNILPMIFYDASVQYQPQIDALTMAQLQNRVLLFGDGSPIIPAWSIEKLEPMQLKMGDIIKMDLPSIGSLHLKNQMRIA